MGSGYQISITSTGALLNFTSKPTDQSLPGQNSDGPLSFSQNKLEDSSGQNPAGSGPAPGQILTGQGAISALTGDLSLTQLPRGPPVDTLQMNILGANPDAQAQGERPLTPISSGPLASYAQVQFDSVLPGVDVAYTGTSVNQLEFSFTLSPGTDAGSVRTQYLGAKDLQLDAAGNLNISFFDGRITTESSPVAYQLIGGTLQLVSSKYVLEGNGIVSYQVTGADPRYAVTIDPVVSGQVTEDGTNDGVADVQVDITDPSGTSVFGSGLTGSDGSYSVDSIEAGAYAAQFTAPSPYVFDGSTTSMLSVPVTVDAEDGGTASATAYQPATVSGTITDDGDNSGLAGVIASLTGPNGYSGQVTTLSDGGYSFTNLVPGAYSLTLSTPGAYLFDPAGATTLSDTPTLNSGDSDTFNASAYQPATVGGQITDDGNSGGLAGTLVNLYDPSFNLVASTTTSGNGLYSFAGLTPQTYTLAFTTPAGYLFDQDANSAWSEQLGVASGDNDTVSTTAYQPASVFGHITDDGSGNGLAGVLVTLLDPAQNTLGSTTTDATGNFSFTGLVPQNDTVLLSSPGADLFDADNAATLVMAANVTSGAAVEDDASANQPAGTVGGNITDAGSGDGLEAVGVTLAQTGGSSFQTATDAQGNFSFSNVAAGGNYQLTFSAPAGYFFAQSNEDTWTTDPFSVASGDAVDQDGDAYQQGSLNGTITDFDTGFGLQGVGVALEDSNGNPLNISTATAPDGTYSLPNLEPGSYIVAFTAPADYLFTESNLDTWSSPFSITSGSSATEDTSAFPDLGTVLGQVTDSISGAGIQGIPVALEDLSGNAIDFTTTDANGNYVFDDVPAGNVQVVFGQLAPWLFVESGGLATWTDSPVTVSAEDSTTVDATAYQAPGSVNGWITDSISGAGIAGVTVALTPSGGATTPVLTDANGYYTFSNVAAGTGYQLDFTAPGGYLFVATALNTWSYYPFDVPGNTGVTVSGSAYLPAGAVSGRVTDDANGQGIANVSTYLYSGRATTKEKNGGRWPPGELGAWSLGAFWKPAFSPVFLLGGMPVPAPRGKSVRVFWLEKRGRASKMAFATCM